MDYAKLMKAQHDKMKALIDAAGAENRDLTTDEQTQFDAANTEHDRLKSMKERSDLVDGIGNNLPAEKEHQPAPLSKAKAKAGDNLAAQKPHENLGAFLRDVANVSDVINDGYGESMERLKNANNTEVGADGGFLVKPDFIGSMMKEAVGMSVLYPLVSEFTVSGNSASFPGVKETSRADGSRFGGVSVGFVGEGDSGTYSQPSFDNRDLKLSKLMGLVKVTDEMQEDSSLLTSWIQKAYPAEMAFAIDQAIYDGDGNGKPLGIIKSPALVSVPKESGQGAGTIVYENIVKMWARMPARRQMRSAWIVTQQAWEQLPLMNQTVGTGGLPVFIPPGGASASPYGTLFGRPVISIEQAVALGTAGDVILADMSDYIMISKGGIKTAQSIHVDFDKAMTSYRFIKRINGCPYTKSSLVSRSKADFLTSPYITVATRA